jgi:hypothetical protein
MLDSTAVGVLRVRFHEVKAKAVFTTANQATIIQCLALGYRSLWAETSVMSSSTAPMPLLTAITKKGPPSPRRLMPQPRIEEPAMASGPTYPSALVVSDWQRSDQPGSLSRSAPRGNVSQML